jgi:hypothetical protein
VHIVRDVVTFEKLNVVTGAQDNAALHWGGSIPLPTPHEVDETPEPLEALTGEPLPAEPQHLALDHRRPSGHGLGAPIEHRDVIPMAEDDIAHQRCDLV